MSEKCLKLSCFLMSSLLLFQSGCQKQAKLTNSSSTTPKEQGIQVQKNANMPNFNRPSPRITFKKFTLDFGDVPPNSMNTGEIMFTNTGRATLKIAKIGNCCGVIAKIDKDKREYAPGESGAVKVEWRSRPQPGVFDRQLVVYSNDKENPVTTLTIRAKTVLRVTWEPTRLRLSPVENNAGCPKVTISSLDNLPFSITGFKSTDDCVTANYDPSVKLTKHIIEPIVNIKKLQKNLKGRIDITMTHPDSSTATILFDMVPEYTFSPPSIMIFNAEPGKSMTKEIALINNYGNDFEIESMSSKSKKISFEVLRKMRIHNGYQLEIEITVPANTGKTKFTDEFSVKIKDGETLPIECNGYYRRNMPRPEIQ